MSETLELKEVMCGDEAAAVRHSLDIRYPVCSDMQCIHWFVLNEMFFKVENGIVKSWDDMEHLWNYTFFEKLVVSVLRPPPIKDRST